MRVARFRLVAFLPLLVASPLALPACITFRPASSDLTKWDEMPNDPRPELWVQGVPRLSVVFDGVYTATGDEEPAFDAQSTDYYLRVLRKARVFDQVLDREAEPGTQHRRIRVERLFQEDANMAANLSMAVTVPGLLGYRFGLLATYKLELEREGDAPAVYEARSRLTRIYYAAGRADASRLLVYSEADRANTAALVNQLRADPALFDSVTPRPAP